jgi:hypothetical protein
LRLKKNKRSYSFSGATIAALSKIRSSGGVDSKKEFQVSAGCDYHFDLPNVIADAQTET